ncbi:MAG TPA: hypothetical protein VEK84_06860 [Terriglobales bacterium]|nr:hypothetical protein [Terriglobales bacterium]
MSRARFRARGALGTAGKVPALRSRFGKGRTMFGSYKVKIEGELLEKVRQCSDAAGYESIDEFVIHMLEKETNKILPPDESNTSKEDVQKRLRGLGYIE